MERRDVILEAGKETMANYYMQWFVISESPKQTSYRRLITMIAACVWLFPFAVLLLVPRQHVIKARKRLKRIFKARKQIPLEQNLVLAFDFLNC